MIFNSGISIKGKENKEEERYANQKTKQSQPKQLAKSGMNQWEPTGANEEHDEEFSVNKKVDKGQTSCQSKRGNQLRGFTDWPFGKPAPS